MMNIKKEEEQKKNIYRYKNFYNYKWRYGNVTLQNKDKEKDYEKYNDKIHMGFRSRGNWW